MRPALLAGVAVLLAPPAGFAQTGRYFATVTAPEVKLRCGPSDRYDETATLRQGDSVLVVREEENGWLAVEDPPGRMYSVSWVLHAFVNFDGTKPTPQDVVVNEDVGVKLAPGRIGLAQPISRVRRVEVPPGTILTVIGAGVRFEGKIWHPVAPPAGDYRYLPKQAVKYDKPDTTAFTVGDNIPPTVTPAGGSVPAGDAVAGRAGGGRPGPGKPPVSHPLWAQAEAAERAGRYDDAEKLLFQLAQMMNKDPNVDHNVANLCYTRIHTLQEKKRAGTGGGRVAAETRPPAGAPSRPATSGTPAAGGSLPPATPAAGSGDDRPRWTGPGKLIRSALALDGRQTYALRSDSGETVVYVVAARGVDLERYVNKRVDVYGVSDTRRGLSKAFVVATAVEAAR